MNSLHLERLPPGRPNLFMSGYRIWYPMTKSTFRGRLLRWGHTKGIRLPTKEAARLDIPVGSEVRVTIEPAEPPLEPRDMMVVHGRPTDSLDHDRIFAEGFAKRRRR